MSRRICMALAVASAFLAGLVGDASADDAIVRQFAGGSAPNMVGIIDASEDVELLGPQALTSDEKGNLFVLDQVNGRILSFDPAKPAAEPTVMQLPENLLPSDLVVSKSDILVWDGSIRTLRAAEQPSTRSVDNEPIRLQEISTRAIDDRIAVSAFAQAGSRPPSNPAELLDQNTRSALIKQTRPTSRQYVASRGKGSVMADILPLKADNAVRVEVRTIDSDEIIAQLALRTQNRIGTVEFLEIDNNDRLYVLAEDIPTAGTGAATFVARFASNGRLEGIYELPLANTPLNRRFVTISGSGDVYFLRTTPHGIDVVGVGFRPLASGAVIKVRKTASPGVVPADRPGAVSAVRPLDRQQVIETAFAFEGIQWRLTPANYGSDPDTSCAGFNRIRRPWYLHGKVNQEVRSVPYCWGCSGSLANFRARIEQGVKAGNVCTQNAPRPDVAGVDCSAFVSATWGLSTHYTTAIIPTIAKPLSDPWDLKPGDALNKPGSHVMLFLRFTSDRKAEVMEAATGGCNGRVCRNIYPLAALLARGYVPVRFRALANDQTVVAASTYKSADGPTGRQKKSRKR